MHIDVPTVDPSLRRSAEEHQAQLTKPRGSLGELERVACELAALQGTGHPQCRPAAALLFAADHPVTRYHIAPYPDTVTAAMVRNFLDGGAAASVLCREQGVELAVIDVGVKHPYEALESRAVRWWREPVANDEVGDLVESDAMSPSTFEQCLDAGRRAVDRLPDDTRVIVLGEMGIGNSTVASAVASALLRLPADRLVGPGTGADPAMLRQKCLIVERAVGRVGEEEPLAALRRLGGRELVALVGAAARAIERRWPVIVDGFIATASLLALVRHEPRVREWLFFAHRSGEPGHAVLLDALNARPLLDLGLRLGEGSGALMALPLLHLACVLHSTMATFAGARVPGALGPT